MTDPDRARALRRRHVHERQAVIFGILLAILAVAGVSAAAIYTGNLSVPFFARGFSSKPTPSVTFQPAPCPPQGALPGVTGVPSGVAQVEGDRYACPRLDGVTVRGGRLEPPTRQDLIARRLVEQLVAACVFHDHIDGFARLIDQYAERDRALHAGPDRCAWISRRRCRDVRQPFLRGSRRFGSG